VRARGRALPDEVLIVSKNAWGLDPETSTEDPPSDPLRYKPNKANPKNLVMKNPRSRIGGHQKL